MSFEDSDRMLFGLQYHPESFLTNSGKQIIQNIHHASMDRIGKPTEHLEPWGTAGAFSTLRLFPKNHIPFRNDYLQRLIEFCKATSTTMDSGTQ